MNHYVYEYIRLDTGEPFYIRKGSGNRWRDTKRSRNKDFLKGGRLNDKTFIYYFSFIWKRRRGKKWRSDL